MEEKNESRSPDTSVAALAYLGDAVMELAVRERLVRHGLCASARLNEAALGYVRATSQAKAAETLLPLLSAEEESVYRRGRNSPHIKNAPKSATLGEYRKASGLETLFGYLYLRKESERIAALLDAAFPDLVP